MLEEGFPFMTECNYYNYDNLDEINIKNIDLGILHLNVHGIASKKQQLLELLNTIEEAQSAIDVLLLCETFMTETNKNVCRIKGYTLTEYEYRKNMKQGGVAIYVKKGVKTVSRKDLNVFKEGEFESCFIELVTDTKHKNIIIGEIYRVPGTDMSEKQFIKEYNNLIDKISKENKEIIIATDQNIDYLKINSNSTTSELFETNLNFQLIPAITKPTRVTHSTATLIDNINISSNLTSNCKTGVILADISDHFPCIALFGKSNKVKIEPYKLHTRKLNEAKILRIRNKLSYVNWNYLHALGVDDALNEFEKKILQVIDSVAPETIKTISNKNVIKEPWMTLGLLTSSKKSNTLFRECVGKQKDIKYENYKTYRNKLNSLKRTAKISYYKTKIIEYKENGNKCGN